MKSRRQGPNASSHVSHKDQLKHMANYKLQSGRATGVPGVDWLCPGPAQPMNGSEILKCFDLVARYVYCALVSADIMDSI